MVAVRLPSLLPPAVASLLAISALACGSSSTSASPTDGGAHDGSVVEGGSPGDAAADGGVDAASDASAADAAADVDNGAPSTNYPAPHPPLPTLTNADHGPVLTTPHVYLVFYPGYTPATITDLQSFAQKVGPSTYWPATTHEYGVGAITYAGTITLTGQTAPTSIASTDIQTWVASQIQSGVFGTPDPQAIYTIVYPSSTMISQPNPVSTLLPASQSCTNFGGYHDNVAVSAADGGAAQNYAYAVIPTCTGSVQDLTAVISHEWIEASTDPFLTSSGVFSISGGPQSAFFTVDTNHSIWAVLGGGEAGDLCEPEAPDVYYTPPDIGYEVQRTWSNLSAAASHDPCVPATAGQAFFDSAPVLTDTVTFTSPITPNITTQGITIPVGMSKTIEVDLFSDGDTGGPWTVTADDVLYKYYGGYGIPASLSFAWDRTSGVNGEKLHLTITVTQASIVGNGHAFMITSTLGSRVAVWPGMVVDK
jgi:hypothetical protein